MADEPRVISPDRSQLSWEMVDLEALLPKDHRARLVWAFVESVDLSEFYAPIRSRGSRAGRPATDPKLLLALWLFATVEGVGSAREIARLVERDLAYRWLVGGASVNYHTLADFRTERAEEMDRILTESVVALIDGGLVKLDEIAVDGTKVRAPVSARSFTRGGRLVRMEAQAKARIEALKREVNTDPGASNRRREAAQKRAAEDLEKRVAKAKAKLDQLRKEKEERAKTHKKPEEKRGDPKVSMTNAETRFIRFADGGIRPGFNVQLATVPKTDVIVAVQVTDRRTDSGLAPALVDEVVERYGRAPATVIHDAGYNDGDDIVALAHHPRGPVKVYSPLKMEKPEADLSTSGRDKRRARARNEPAEIKEWRGRMETDEAKTILKRRAHIEHVNGRLKNRGFERMTIRGLAKTKAVAVLYAIAHNMLAGFRLQSTLPAAA